MDGPSGLGGWLVLVQIGLYVSIIRLLVLIKTAILPSLQPDVWDFPAAAGRDEPLWKPALVFEAAVNVIFVLFIVYLLVILYRKKSTFPRWMIIFYVFNLMVLIADYILMANIQIMQELEIENSTQEIGRVILSSAIWIPYFIRSRRVRNTFIN